VARKELRDTLRITGAERRWYRELGVDPATDNEVLRAGIESVARVEGLTGLGMTFMTLPSVPGAGEMQRTLGLVWETDPLDLLRANRERMLDAGLSKETARAFEDSALTLTEQTLLLNSLDDLEGVAGREHLVARALALEDRRRARALVQIAAHLAHLHGKGTALAQILPDSILPVARTRTGDLVAVSVADAVFWTERIAEAAQEFATLYADRPVNERRLYFTGVTSERFKTEAASLGWKVTDQLPRVELR
jgi:hypothetical protein